MSSREIAQEFKLRNGEQPLHRVEMHYIGG
jgi:hypothetical protein